MRLCHESHSGVEILVENPLEYNEAKHEFDVLSKEDEFPTTSLFGDNALNHLSSTFEKR